MPNKSVCRDVIGKLVRTRHLSLESISAELESKIIFRHRHRRMRPSMRDRLSVSKGILESENPDKIRDTNMDWNLLQEGLNLAIQWQKGYALQCDLARFPECRSCMERLY